MATLKVFTFSPAWGLRTTGPFALKLLKWLDLAGTPYEQVIEDQPSKGPKGKNPWIEMDGRRIGDTEIIIDMLSRRSGFRIDDGLSPEQLAVSHAMRRMIEEHFHMVYEWELFVHPNGAAGARTIAETIVPPFLAGPAAAYIRRRFRRQLYQRGLARHPDDVVLAKARADIAAVEALLGNRPYLLGARPCMADVAIYGLMYPMTRWPMHTPAADHIKSRPALVAYLDRLHQAKAEARAAA